ncbi:MAG: patatin-like phospholipase family protein, partial [Burkholderiales bacterium]|nr:patatin-like phospholipase family protein [Burkholderiales bacterium]
MFLPEVGVTARRTLSLIAASLVAASLALGGCAPPLTRPPVTEQDLLKQRSAGDEQALAEGRRMLDQVLARAKAEHDRHAAGELKTPPVIDILIVSGGGDWGAFGAGFLKGWQKVPAQHPLAKPEFDAVTGVSTGALIAPFAFLGDEQSIDQIVSLYRNPQKDWVQRRGMLYFL